MSIIWVFYKYIRAKYLKLNTFEFLRIIRVRQKILSGQWQSTFHCRPRNWWKRIHGESKLRGQRVYIYIYIHIPMSFHQNSSSKKQRKSGWLSFSYVQYYESRGEHAIRALIFNCLSPPSMWDNGSRGHLLFLTSRGARRKSL